jgi:hypothetical protein
MKTTDDAAPVDETEVEEKVGQGGHEEHQGELGGGPAVEGGWNDWGGAAA